LDQFCESEWVFAIPHASSIAFASWSLTRSEFLPFPLFPLAECRVALYRGWYLHSLVVVASIVSVLNANLLVSRASLQQPLVALSSPSQDEENSTETWVRRVSDFRDIQSLATWLVILSVVHSCLDWFLFLLGLPGMGRREVRGVILRRMLLLGRKCPLSAHAILTPS
jgi:hypothetical protein